MRWIAVVALLLASCSTQVEEERPPNIVLLLGDDHGYPYFGFTGSEWVQTPAMDRLADTGALFPIAHVTDNHCRPSLQSLMTGYYPLQYEQMVVQHREAKRAADPALAALEGQELADWELEYAFHSMAEFTTLPELLAEQGYASWQGGKWWEQSYENGGFTHGMSTGWSMEERTQPGWFERFMGGDGMVLGRETMQPAFDFIDEHVDQPFYLWYGPSLPHTPLNPPERHYNLYADTELSESAKLYYGNATWWDEGVEQLVAHIESKDLLENTIFVYVNDNGWEQPPFVDYTPVRDLFLNGGTRGKLGLHDLSFRFPLLVNWPGTIDPSVFEGELVSSIDIVPTLLDYAGANVPDNLPGMSLRPVIEGGEIESRDALMGRITQTRSDTDAMGQRTTGYYYRNQQWHYMWWKDLGREELYDMQADPGAENDVAPDHQDMIQTFQQAITQWEEDLLAAVRSD